MKLRLRVLSLSCIFLFLCQYTLAEDLVTYDEVIENIIEPVIVNDEFELIIKDSVIVNNEPTIFNVIVPMNIDFIMDPAEISGRGQVYSDTLEIRNDGESDVLFTFTDVVIECTEGVELSPYEGDWEKDLLETRKLIWLAFALNFDDEQTEVISLTDFGDTSLFPIDFVFTPESVLTFEVIGAMSQYPFDEWRDKDVKIRMSYQIEEIEAPPIGYPGYGDELPPGDLMDVPDKNEDMAQEDQQSGEQLLDEELSEEQPSDEESSEEQLLDEESSEGQPSDEESPEEQLLDEESSERQQSVEGSSDEQSPDVPED